MRVGVWPLHQTRVSVSVPDFDKLVMSAQGNLTSMTDTCTTSPFPITHASVTGFDLVGLAMLATCHHMLMDNASSVWPLSGVRAGVTGLRYPDLTVPERLASYSPREWGIEAGI